MYCLFFALHALVLGNIVAPRISDCQASLNSDGGCIETVGEEKGQAPGGGTTPSPAEKP